MKLTVLLPILLFSLSVIAAPTLFKEGSINLQAVSIGDSAAADSKSLLDIKSTTKGVLFPRMTTTQMNAISSPTTGLMIWNTTAGTLYQYNGSAWLSLDTLPSQTGNSGKYLTTNGTTTSWATVDAFPSQAGNSGKYLTTNGTTTSWGTVDVLPTQTGNSGKFLTTNGTTASWANTGLSTQGQTEGSGVTTTTLKAPNNQLTTTGTNERIVETGNNNLLINPSFEHSTTATGYTTGVGVATSNSTTRRHGAKALNLDFDVSTGVIISQDVTPPAGLSLKGVDVERYVQIKNNLGSSGLTFCSRMAGSTIGSCLPIATHTDWQPYRLNYPGEASSSVGWSIVAASTNGNLDVDDGYLGKDRGNSGTVAQARFFGGMEQAGSGTGTCSYAENTSTGFTDFVALGVGTGCNAWTTSGSVTATGTNDHRPVLSNMGAGTYYVEFIGSVYAAAQNCIYRLSDGTTTYQPQTVRGSGTDQAAPGLRWVLDYPTAPGTKTLQIQAADNGSGICQIQNSAVGLNAAWKVTYVPSQSQTVVSTQQAEFNETDCASALGANVTGTWVSNTTYTCKVSRKKNRAYFDINAATSGTPTATALQFTLPVSIDTAKYTSLISTESSLGGSGFAIDGATTSYPLVPVYVSATSVRVVAIPTASSFGNISTVTNTVPFTFGAGDSVNIRFDVPVVGWIENPFPLIPQSVIAKDSLGVTTINTVVSKSADYTATTDEETILVDSSGATRTITLPAAASVKGKKYELVHTSSTNQTIIDPNASETVCGQTTIRLSGIRDSVIIQSDGTNWVGLGNACYRTISFSVGTTVCSASPCTLSSNVGNAISTLVWNSNGSYTGNYNTGTFSSPAVCNGNATDGSGNVFIMTVRPPPTSSSTQVFFATFSGASLANTVFTMSCTGPR